MKMNRVDIGLLPKPRDLPRPAPAPAPVQAPVVVPPPAVTVAPIDEGRLASALAQALADALPARERVTGMRIIRNNAGLIDEIRLVYEGDR